jgi:hypothetical protein
VHERAIQMCGREESACACYTDVWNGGVCVRVRAIQMWAAGLYPSQVCAQAVMEWPILHTSVYSPGQFHILRG